MLALGHDELMTQHQDLGILPPRLRRGKPSSDTARVTIKKISLKPASRRSSLARRRRLGPASRVPDARPSRRRPGDVCTGGTDFGTCNEIFAAYSVASVMTLQVRRVTASWGDRAPSRRIGQPPSWLPLDTR